MKKVFLFVAFVAALSSVNAQEVQQNAIKINPLSLIFATGNVSYEKAVSSNQSVQLGVFYSGFSLSGLKYSGFGVTPEYRFYFAGKKEALNGVYAAPFHRYQSYNLTDKDTDDKTKFSSFGGGATIGWQKMWNSGFVLDIFAGPAFNAGKFKSDADEDEFDLTFGMNGFGLRTGITLGFGF